MSDKVDYELNLGMLFKTLWRRLPIILLVSVFCAFFAFFYYRTPVVTTYTGRASFFIKLNITDTESITNTDGDSSVSNTTSSTSYTSSVDTYCYMATSPSVLDSIISHADLPYSPKELSQIVTAKQENTKAFAFSILVQLKDEQEALKIAQAFSSYLPGILSAMSSNAAISVLDEGSVSSSSTGGVNTKKPVVAALIAGILTTFLFAAIFVFRSLSGRIGVSLYDINRIFPDKKVLSIFYSDQDTDALKRLRSNLYLTFSDKAVCRMIGLTGAHPDSAKDSLAKNLAKSIAEMGDRVLLVDTDSCSSLLRDYSKAGTCVSLNELIQRPTTDGAQLQSINENGSSFSFLSVGGSASDTSEPVDCRKIIPAVSMLKEEFDYILVNLEAIGSSVDAAVTGKELDGILVSVREERCSLNQFINCLAQLEYASAKVSGIVLFKKKPVRFSQK